MTAAMLSSNDRPCNESETRGNVIGIEGVVEIRLMAVRTAGRCPGIDAVHMTGARPLDVITGQGNLVLL